MVNQLYLIENKINFLFKHQLIVKIEGVNIQKGRKLQELSLLIINKR